MRKWTTNPDVDDTLQGLITACNAAFPGHGLSYYLIGSWAEDESNQISDVDVVVVWTHGTPTKADLARGERIVASLSPPVRLDAFMTAESDVPASLIGVNVKLSSSHLSGPDIRARLPLPPLETYRESVTQGARYFMTRILRDVETLAALDYPDPADEFFGYAVKRVDAWYPKDVTAGLKEWVSTATRIARALVAIQCGRYVGSKREAVAVYHDCVGGQWAEYVSLLYGKGKTEWAYRIPADVTDRTLLRDLGRRFLGFEKHFLTETQDQWGKGQPVLGP